MNLAGTGISQLKPYHAYHIVTCRYGKPWQIKDDTIAIYVGKFDLFLEQPVFIKIQDITQKATLEKCEKATQRYNNDKGINQTFKTIEEVDLNVFAKYRCLFKCVFEFDLKF